MNWQMMVVQLVAAIVGAAGIGEMIKVLTSRRSRAVVRVDVAAKASEIALEVADRLEKQAKIADVNFRRAQDEVRQIKEEATKAHQRVTILTAEVDGLLARIRRYTNAIMSPTSTVEDLRAMVRYDSSNGNTPT